MYSVACHIWMRGSERPVSVTITSDSVGNQFYTEDAAREYRKSLMQTYKELSEKCRDQASLVAIDSSIMVNPADIVCVYCEVRKRA